MQDLWVLKVSSSQVKKFLFEVSFSSLPMTVLVVQYACKNNKRDLRATGVAFLCESIDLSSL